MMAFSPEWPQVCLLAYPVLVHLSIVTGSGVLTWLALAVLAFNLLGRWLARGRFWPWLLLGFMLAGAGALVARTDGRFFLYAAPVLIALALAWLFGRTLLPGETPLISRIATAIRGPLPAVVERYTRGVTWFWLGAMCCLALANLALALFASPVVWSLFTNGINYLLVGAFFLLEWWFRGWFLRGYESLTWRGYVAALRRLDYRQLFHG